MASQQVDEYISNELIKTTLDPFDLASDLDMHSLPDNLSLIVQQLTTKLSAIFNAGKRPVTNAISLLPLDHLPGNSLQDFFGGLNHQLITDWFQQHHPPPPPIPPAPVQVIKPPSSGATNNVNHTDSAIGQEWHFQRVKGENNEQSHKYKLRNQSRSKGKVNEVVAVSETAGVVTKSIIEFLGNIPLVLAPENQYLPKFVKRRRGRPRTRLNIYEKLLSKDDLSAINALNQLATPFFNINNLVSRIEQLGVEMVAPTLLELVTVTQVPEENWSVFVEQIERTTINMREFKEHLYRMIFLKFGLLIDKVVPNWSQNQQRVIDGNQNEGGNDERRYTWFYQTFLILYKLKLKCICVLEEAEQPTEFKEGFDAIISLIIQIENASLIEKIQEQS